MSEAKPPAIDAAGAGPPRSDAIDLVRGAVMALMVLDHTRDFFTDTTHDPLDLSKTTTALFLTRWVTHFCAPVFVFLAGTGAFLQRAAGRGQMPLALSLVTRGLWLVVLELTLVHLGWFFNFRYDFLIAQVIWAIGGSMVALAGLSLLPAWAVALVGVALVAGHNGLGAPWPAPRWMVLAQLRPGILGPDAEGGTVLLMAYPILPWLGVMALGYGFGALWHAGRKRRLRTAALGLLALGLFLALRGSAAYGDPKPWKPDEDVWKAALSFLDCSKYPPSLLYVLMTLGPALLALAAADRPLGPIAGVLVTFGRVPLFFYLLHVPLIHLAALGVAWMRYGHAGFLLTHPLLLGREGFPSDYGYGLPGVYLATVLILVALSPLCRWMAALKRRHPGVWRGFI
jgi:uncharacterized membrane protein